MAATDKQIFDLIRKSSGYKDPDPKPISSQDRTKVDKALAGVKSEQPSSFIGQAAWELAKRLAPPPPPAFKKVAPRVAHKQDGSDARFCLGEEGALRPGVFQRPDGKYSDESGAVYTNLDGLDESGIRSDAPAPTGAKEINGRPYCSLPTEGDPTKNTGSWSI
jgi:hypothetical protein